MAAFGRRAWPIAAAALLACWLACRLQAKTYVPTPPASTAALAIHTQIFQTLMLESLLLLHIGLRLLPGIAAGSVALALYVHRARLNKKVCGAVVLVIFSGLFVLMWRIRAAAEPAAAPTMVQADAYGRPVKSGEEVLLNDGSFMRMADREAAEEGIPLSDSWQQVLVSEMSQAIADNDEQVILMFSRSGCPWCDRQLPVMRRAIKRRAMLAGQMAPNLAFVGAAAPAGAGDVPALMNSPLRVFILDAHEFPSMMERFQVDAFPTSLVFGKPGVTPLMAKGYLDDETLDKVMRSAAEAEPEQRVGRGKRKFLGIFR